MSILKNFAAKIAGKFIAGKLGLKEDKDMEDKKKWWQSKTVLQGVALALINIYEALAPALIPMGITLPVIPGFLIAVLNALLGGGIIYTRTVATKQIS